MIARKYAQLFFHRVSLSLCRSLSHTQLDIRTAVVLIRFATLSLIIFHDISRLPFFLDYFCLFADGAATCSQAKW